MDVGTYSFSAAAFIDGRDAGCVARQNVAIVEGGILLRYGTSIQSILSRRPTKLSLLLRADEVIQ
ncbi:MAG TPA: hypothetical protein VFI80_01285 [Burkholderiales bacterium]|nr:hypothetical protein [Burkholderiales bacterium]